MKALVIIDMLRIIVPEDAVEAMSDTAHAAGLDYLRRIYNVETPVTRAVVEA